MIEFQKKVKAEIERVKEIREAEKHMIEVAVKTMLFITEYPPYNRDRIKTLANVISELTYEMCFRLLNYITTTWFSKNENLIIKIIDEVLETITCKRGVHESNEMATDIARYFSSMEEWEILCRLAQYSDSSIKFASADIISETILNDIQAIGINGEISNVERALPRDYGCTDKIRTALGLNADIYHEIVVMLRDYPIKKEVVNSSIDPEFILDHSKWDEENIKKEIYKIS